jgi:hypothetical protein
MNLELKMDTKAFGQELQKIAEPEIERLAFEEAEKIVEENKQIMLKEFDNHPVTQEIKAGADSDNLSKTLDGYGNLFSFIGFAKGSDPIGVLRSMLDFPVKISKKASSKTKGRYSFSIDVPNTREIEAETPLPYEPSRSWVKGIERGISGIGYYIYKKINSSRSGSGVQSQKQLRGGRFGNTSYLTKILDKFYKNSNIK